MRSFGKFLAGNPTRPPAPVSWLPVGRRSSSQGPRHEQSVFRMNERSFEIEIPCILLFLKRNRNSQDSPKRINAP